MSIRITPAILLAVIAQYSHAHGLTDGVTFSASPTSVGVGQTSTLSWSSSADTCTASGAWSGAKASSGSEVVTVNAASTYTLDCTDIHAATVAVKITAQLKKAHWKLDEGVGITTGDASGNSNTGTLTNGPAWVAGKFGNALGFDAVNDRVVVPASSSINSPTSAITVMAWVWHNANQVGKAGVASRIFGATVDSQWLLQVRDNKARFYAKSASNPGGISGTTTVPLNQWHHIAGVYDGALTRIYYDGVQEGTTAATGALQQDTNKDVLIGAIASGTTIGELFNGRIDDIKLFNTALTATQIQAEMLDSTSPAIPPLPQGAAYMSDLVPFTSINGLGPVELDRSNGGSAAGDGRVLELNGEAYAKGLGVNARSDVQYSMGGKVCTRFKATIGIDDEIVAGGSVTFEVYTWNGTSWVGRYISPVMTAVSESIDIDVDISGTQYTDIALTVNDAGDGITDDHADWALANIECAPDVPTPPPTPPPPQPAFITGINTQLNNEAGGLFSAGDKAALIDLGVDSVRWSFNHGDWASGMAWSVANNKPGMLFMGYSAGCEDIKIAANRQCYADRAAGFATTYGANQYYEVWNEWNGGLGLGCKFGTPPCNDGAMYADLLCRTYTAIKAVHPTAKVIGGGMAGIDIPFATKVLNAGGGACMDAIVVHPYVFSQNAYTVGYGGTVSAAVAKVKQGLTDMNALVFQKLGKSLPFAITEDGRQDRGLAAEETKTSDYVTALYNELKLPQAFPMMGIWWFTLDDGAGFTWGVRRANQTQKPSYAALKAQ